MDDDMNGIEAQSPRPRRRKRTSVTVPLSWTMTPKGAAMLRPRAMGFSPEKQRLFLKTLRKTGCVMDGCRKARVSSQTAYRARRRLLAFAQAWETALKIAASDIELLAWDRAVEGVEVATIRDGKVVAVTRKPSDAIFRMILMASNPKKYGRMSRGGETAKQIEARVRAKLGKPKKRASREKLAAAIMKNLEGLNKRRRAQGYREGPDGSLIPPRWGPTEEEPQRAQGWVEGPDGTLMPPEVAREEAEHEEALRLSGPAPPGEEGAAEDIGEQS